MQRLPHLADIERAFTEEPHLVLGRVSFKGDRIWAVYLNMPDHFERLEHQIIPADDDQETVVSRLMALIERGVQALPGSTFKAINHSSAEAIKELTGLQLDKAPRSLKLTRDLSRLRDSMATPPPNAVPAPKSVPPSDIVIATDASRRADGRSAYGWVAVFPGQKIPPMMTSRRVEPKQISFLETAAVMSALKKLCGQMKTRKGDIHVMSDSRQALHHVTQMLEDTSFSSNLWKTHGRDGGPQLMRISNRIKLHWVKGHSGNPANELVDTLVRGETLATTNEGVDKLALQGLHSIIQKRLDHLTTLDRQDLLEGAVPYTSESYEEDQRFNPLAA